MLELVIFTRINSEISQPAYIGIGDNLEHQGAHWRIIRRALKFDIAVGLGGFDSRESPAAKAGNQPPHLTKLYAFIAQRAAGKNRGRLGLQSRPAQRSFQFLGADLFAFQVLHGEVIISLGDLLNQALASLLSRFRADQLGSLNLSARPRSSSQMTAFW
jgi:hypothetical protein